LNHNDHRTTKITKNTKNTAFLFVVFVIFVVFVVPAITVPTSVQLPLEPVKDSGQSVTGAYEGWYVNADGTFTLLVGYFNRNQKEILDIAVGPNNRIEPGGPDQGQPTHFLPRRQWGVFTITVPKDFGDKKLIWTVVANGQTTSIPMTLNPLWVVEPFKSAGVGNTPPVVRFEPGGTGYQGPPRGIGASLSAKLSEPLTLTAWVTDDGRLPPEARARPGPVATLSWSMFRGPGAVTFGDVRPKIDDASGKATTTATFSAAGEYILRAQANDASGDGGGGFQCCWTNAHVKVIVK
jgi:hypothetical protein